MTSTTEFLLPFAGRNHSGATNQNLLCKAGNVYIMDNHRAAMWCWLQEVPEDGVVGLFHIDEHYDTLYSRIEEWKASLPALRGLRIGEYLGLTTKTELGTTPTIRWDNYLSLFLECFTGQIERSVFATHGVGDKPKTSPVIHVEPWDLPYNMQLWNTNSPSKWIVNVDLDYFFCDQDGVRKPMFSNEYVDAVFSAIRRSNDEGRVACVTLCLTPDDSYTGGWAQAEALCARACDRLGIHFKLP